MKSVELHDAANLELHESAIFIETARTGYGERFLRTVENAFERLALFPHIGVKTVHRSRMVKVPRFDYDIIYRVERHRIYIIAIAHHGRSRNYWRSRLR